VDRGTTCRTTRRGKNTLINEGCHEYEEDWQSYPIVLRNAKDHVDDDKGDPSRGKYADPHEPSS